MKHMLLAIASLALASCLAADAPYTCYLRVGTQEAERKTDTSGGKGKKKGSSTKTKTLTSTTSWPVSVSLRGKDIPSSDAVKLKCYFFGKTDGVPEKLGERVLDVSLDDKGDFKTDVTSPEAKLVHTTATTKSGGRGGRGRGGRGGRGRGSGNVSTNTRTSTSGTRVTGCIIQLVVKGKVEGSFASNSRWSRLAKEDPVDTEEVLKML